MGEIRKLYYFHQLLVNEALSANVNDSNEFVIYINYGRDVEAFTRIISLKSKDSGLFLNTFKIKLQPTMSLNFLYLDCLEDIATKQ